MGVTEGEYPAVRGDQPVAVAIGGRGEVDDRRVEVLAAHRSVEAGVTEGEDASVSGHQPVAVAVGSGHDMGDGRVEGRARHPSVVEGVAVGGDVAVGLGQPVAVTVGGGGHAHGGRRQRADGLTGDRAHRVGVGVLASGGGGGPVRPDGLAGAVDRVAGLGSGHHRSGRNRHPLVGVLARLAGVGGGDVPVLVAVQLDRPGLVGGTGHPHPHQVVGGTQLVLPVVRRGHVGPVHPVGAVARPEAVAGAARVGGEDADLSGRGRGATRTGTRR